MTLTFQRVLSSRGWFFSGSLSTLTPSSHVKSGTPGTGLLEWRQGACSLRYKSFKKILKYLKNVNHLFYDLAYQWGKNVLKTVTKSVIKLKCFSQFWEILPDTSCFHVVNTHVLTLRTHKPAEVIQAKVWDLVLPQEGAYPRPVGWRESKDWERMRWDPGTPHLHLLGYEDPNLTGEDRLRETGPFTSDHAEHGRARIHASPGPGKCMNLNQGQVIKTQSPYHCATRIHCKFELYVTPQALHL